MANYYYGELKLTGPQETLDKLAAQLERLEECCWDFGDADPDYLPAIFADYPVEQGVFSDGWNAKPGSLELYTRGRNCLGDEFAAIVCKSLGLNGTLSVEGEEDVEYEFEFSGTEDVPTCKLRELDG